MNNEALRPYIPYGRQTVTEEDINAVIKTLRSPYLTQGPKVEEFEQVVARTIGANHAIAVNSATSALHIACLALDLGHGDILWTTPTTFVASANCARYCGAKVDFVDIDLETGLMCTKALEKKLFEAKENSCLPKIVIPVHLCGTSCDMEKINSLAREYNFKIIEDASHAIGGTYKGRPVGDCYKSSISIFSFHPVKILTTGEGGMATTNDKQLATKMRDLRSHGIVKDTDRFKRETAELWTYEQQELGFNYRITDIQASLGISQIKRLPEMIRQRNQLHQRYREKIDSTKASLLKIPKEVTSALHLAVILLKSKNKNDHRRVFNGMRAANIGVQVHYLPVHLQPYYRNLGFNEGYAPNAEQYAHRAISIPIYPGLQEEEQDYVVQTLHQLICGG